MKLRLQNKICLLPAAVFLLLAVNSSYSQIRPDISEILEQYGSFAKAYFLSANRPSYGVSPYTISRHKFGLDISVSGNNEVFDLPVSLSYGVAKNTEVLTGISLYTLSYNFRGQKIQGLGDANIGIKYKFQESNYFSHAVQMIIKIPTANSTKELGTGFADFHFGAAQGFYSQPWGYDFSLELNLLRRRSLPSGTRVPPELQQSIDSIKSLYNYNFESEVVISFGPSLDISQKFALYAGFSFSRNIKLNFNASQIYTGLGYQLSDKAGIGVSASFGILHTYSYILSAGVNFEF